MDPSHTAVSGGYSVAPAIMVALDVLVRRLTAIPASDR